MRMRGKREGGEGGNWGKGEGGGGERGKRGERREANGATATSGDAGDESERSGPVLEILRFVVSFRARAPCSFRAYWPPLFRRCIRKIQSWTPQGQRGEPWGASLRRTRANRSTAAELRGQLRRRPFSPPPPANQIALLHRAPRNWLLRATKAPKQLSPVMPTADREMAAIVSS